jgi:hypothetical protein
MYGGVVGYIPGDYRNIAGMKVACTDKSGIIKRIFSGFSNLFS